MIRAHARGASARNARRVFRQLVGDRRRRRRALLSGRRRPLRRASRADAHPDEGGDAQSSDGDRAVSGRGDRRGRRDPRRRRDRHRRQAEGRPRRLHDVAPAHSGAAAAVGDRTTASPTASRRRCRSCWTGRSARASFNNEFGRPNLAGYFRTFEHRGRRARCAAITSRS